MEKRKGWFVRGRNKRCKNVWAREKDAGRMKTKKKERKESELKGRTGRGPRGKMEGQCEGVSGQ